MTVTDRACARCGARKNGGRASRWLPLLPLAPVVLGAISAIAVMTMKEKLGRGPLIAAVTGIFLVFLAVLAVFARQLLRGDACPRCGDVSDRPASPPPD